MKSDLYWVGGRDDPVLSRPANSILDLFEIGMDRPVPKFIPQQEGFCLNVGAGRKMIAGTIPLDLPDWDADKDPIPFPDDSISCIHAYHFLEHVRYPVDLLMEFQRVLKNGGAINIVVPYYSSQANAQDLDHKNVFCEGTWDNIFKNPYYDKTRKSIKWELSVQACYIMGLVERNLCLVTQLTKKVGV